MTFATPRTITRLITRPQRHTIVYEITTPTLFNPRWTLRVARPGTIGVEVEAA